MTDIEEYQKDFVFFEKFSTNYIFRLVKRLSVVRQIPFSSIPFLCLPVAILPAGKLREKALALKYSLDLSVIRLNMPETFPDGKVLSFSGYTFNSLSSVANWSDTEKIFSALKLLRGIFLEDEYNLKKMLSHIEKPIIIDCGANIGIFSLFARIPAPGAKIYAFEPASNTFDLMKKLIEENGIKDIIPINAALGERTGEATLLKSNSGLGLSNRLAESDFISGEESQLTIIQKVKLTTIDNFVFEEKKFEKVDLIKIDAEGFESRILVGAKKTIKKFRPVIICAAYHMRDDETVLPALIMRINPTYKFNMQNRGEKILICY